MGSLDDRPCTHKANQIVDALNSRFLLFLSRKFDVMRLLLARASGQGSVEDTGHRGAQGCFNVLIDWL